MNPAETNLAVFQFIELLSIISILCLAFILFLLSYIKSREKNRNLEEQNRKERLVTETITQVQENERSRISRDLHDTVTQDIRTALLYAHKLGESKNLSEDEKSLLQKIQKIEEENLKNIRNIIRNLTPSEIESASITRLLSELCENTSERSGIACKFYAEETELLSKITTEQKLHIFRIIQESINNAIKHAKASEVSVIVRKENDSTDAKSQGLLFMISDDGIGFSPIQEESQDIISQSTRLGIKGMKSRAALLGAKFEIKSDEETGTQVKLFLPVK
ncbi:MAG: sensor histidine kinase [Treponema sp.]|uniref:sensor histidine kinase n=1 Tax=Treponema sp. TaxID=166 RepID=UPI0025E66105|nr:sensor histidine kinase [Treponema sp.]MBR0495521.1 sensor histidine kinase [Treponema sp.]